MSNDRGYRAFCPVVERADHNERYFTLWLRSETIAAASPGQFVLVGLPGNVFKLRIPLGVHDVDDDRFAVMVKVVGEGTAALQRLSAGDTLDVMGPLGHGFLLPQSGNVLLVSGGIGYAPLRLLHRRLERVCSVRWLHGGRTEADIFPADEQYREDALDVLRGGLVTDGLRRALAGGGCDRVFACGPHAMLAECARQCSAACVPLEVSMEAYMACGIGVCHGCAVAAAAGGYLAACKDGPVFDAREVNWDA